jgi:hypothetical protein
VDEHGIEDHPELMDPDWQRHAEKEAWIDLRRNRRRARRGRRVAIFAVVLVVVVGAGFAFYRWGKATSEQYTGEPPVAGGSTVLTTRAAPTDLPDYAPMDLSRPFDNTPAQNWAAGITGLTVPAATKVGPFSAQQVSSALAQVKQAIAVAHFDTNTLLAHNPEGYLSLLAPDARAQVRAQAAEYMIYLADGYHLLPVQPRMTGSLTVREGGTGELVVHASYVVAYAFAPGTAAVTGPGDIEPFIREDTDYVLRSGAHWKTSSRGLWPDSSQGYVTEAACDSLDKGFVAPAYSDSRLVVTSVSDEAGQFDPTKPMPTLDTCSH